MGEKQTQNNPQIFRQTTHELSPKQKSTKKIEVELDGGRMSRRVQIWN